MLDTGIRSSRWAALAAVTIITLALVCFGQKKSKPAASSSADQYLNQLRDQAFIDAGAAIFVRSCSSAYCHGAGGAGGGAPRLRGRDLEPGYLYRTISSGVPGTAMASFKSDLTDEQRWKLVAFILSPVRGHEAGAQQPGEGGQATASAASEAASAGASLEGDPANGRDLFYDLANQRSCHSCHAVHGVGGKVGPDLGLVAAQKSPAEVLAAIVKRPTITDPEYETINITLANGDKIVGIKKEDSGDLLRVYDTTVLPAVLRTVLKSEIVRMEASRQSIMPSNYASLYTRKQLADIVAFIKSEPPKPER